MKLIALLIWGLCVTTTANSQSDSIPSIAGWNSEQHNGVYHFFLAGGKIDYYIMPVSKGAPAGELEGWIKQQGLKDIKAASWTDMGTGQSQTQTFGSYYLTTVKDQQGKKLIAMYVAYLRSDKAVRWAKIFYPASDASNGNAVATAAKHFGMLARKETVNGSVINQPSKIDKQIPNESTQSTEPAATHIKASNIKGVVMHSESTIGVGGLVGYVVKPYLFFNDGAFYGLLDTDPYNIDPIASRRANPGKWGHWQMDGKNIIIRWDKDGKVGEWTPSRWSWALPATGGEKIAGSFSSITGGGNSAYGGGSYAMSSKYITFNRNGQFTFETVGSGGYSGAGGSNSAWSSSNSAGTYVLDGYSIELRFNNGKVIRNGFNFYDEKKDMLSIGSSIYIKEE